MQRSAWVYLLTASLLATALCPPVLQAQRRPAPPPRAQRPDRYQDAVRGAARERMTDRDRDRLREAAAYRAGQRSGYGSGVAAGAIRNEVRNEARRRYYRGVSIHRPHGHWYPGFGMYRNDNSAWKWLAFTAITLKVLDNLNEAAQRRHEDAQIRASTAMIGVPQRWEDDGAYGSVTATREFSDRGLQCREFRQVVEIGGRQEEAYGTACLQPDGAWKIR